MGGEGQEEEWQERGYTGQEGVARAVMTREVVFAEKNRADN